jgi:hypothetical protein
MDTPPEFLCLVCDEPIDLTIDLNADENGQAVHGCCYIDRLKAKADTGTSRNPAA